MINICQVVVNTCRKRINNYKGDEVWMWGHTARKCVSITVFEERPEGSEAASHEVACGSKEVAVVCCCRLVLVRTHLFPTLHK